MSFPVNRSIRLFFILLGTCLNRGPQKSCFNPFMIRRTSMFVLREIDRNWKLEQILCNVLCETRQVQKLYQNIIFYVITAAAILFLMFIKHSLRRIHLHQERDYRYHYHHRSHCHIPLTDQPIFTNCCCSSNYPQSKMDSVKLTK